MLRQGGLVAPSLILLIVLHHCRGESLRLAVIPDPEEHLSSPSAHELPAYAAGLEELGYDVTLLEKVEEDAFLLEGLLGSSKRPEDAYFDAVLAQGNAAV